MKIRRSTRGLPFLPLALLLPIAPPLQAQDTAHVVIVATTDVHGHATGWDYVDGAPFPGGLTRVGSVVDSLRRRYPGQVVLVDAGDLIEGSPFAAYYATVSPRDPNPMVDAFNALGYDAAVPGNHEFNFGVPFFRRAMAGARYAVVAANILAPDSTPIFAPVTVVRRGGVNIAIGGLTTPGSMVWDGAQLRGKVQISRIESAAPFLLARLRAEGDVAVVLIHSGMDGASSYDTTGIGTEDAAATLAAGRARPDLVVVGHSHREMVDSVINGVHFVQPKAFARSVAVVHLSLARRGGRWTVTAVHAGAIPLAREKEDPALVRRLADEASAVAEWIRQPVGFATGAFPATAARVSATPLVGLIGEVERRAAHADLASTPAFSTSHGLPAGEVRRSDIFAVYPYDNTLKAIRISGAQLRAYLEQSARYFEVGAGGKVGLNDSIPGYNYDMVWGADYFVDLSRPVGQRITGLSVRGRPVAPTDSFTLALNNYRQAGGGGFDMLAGARVTYEGHDLLRDLLERAVSRDTLRPRDYARENWRLVPDRAANEARALFGLGPIPRAAVPTDSVLLRIVAVGPLRGQLEPADGLGGVAALKTVVDGVSSQCECPVLRVAVGDLLRGTAASDLVHGTAMVEALNTLGLRGTAIGPTDLAWSPDTLRARIAESRFTWLSADPGDSASGRRPDWAVPFHVVDISGRRVAMLGFTGRADSLDGRSVAALRDAASAARAERATFLVLLSSADGAPIARALPGVFDVIVAAAGGDSVVAGTPVLTPGALGRRVGRVDLIRTVIGGRTWRWGVDTVHADAVRPDPAEAALLTRYRALADSAAGEVVARSKLPLPRRAGPSPLGNLVADSWRNALRTSVAIVADTALQSDLPAGPLTVGMLDRFLGRYRTIVRRRWSGAMLRRYLEAGLNTDAHPHVYLAGMTVTFDPGRDPGRRIREIRLSDGSKLRDKSEYTVAVATDVPVIPGTEVPGADGGAILAVDALSRYLRALPQPVEAPEGPRFVARD